MLEGIGLICKVSKNNIRWEGTIKRAQSSRHHERQSVGRPSRHSQEQVEDPLSHVDQEVRDRYKACTREKQELEKAEQELDELIGELEQQKKSICSDRSYSQYAYVTYKDLQNLPLWKNQGNSAIESHNERLVIAIQTPHGSLLNLESQKHN